MSYLTQTISQILAVGTIFMQAAIILALFLALLRKGKPTLNLVSRNVLWIGLFVSSASVVLSLYYSDIVGFAPCILCWYQRIFMYPLVPIFILALVKKDRRIIDYALLLSILGLLVAIYHNLVYYFNLSDLPCAAYGISCVQRFVSEVGGYVSIPMMSLTGFLFLTTVLLVSRINRE
jgi:disulfide bond formation protein DsbB